MKCTPHKRLIAMIWLSSALLTINAVLILSGAAEALIR